MGQKAKARGIYQEQNNHEKLVVVDSWKWLIGSHNWDPASFYASFNASVYFEVEANRGRELLEGVKNPKRRQ